MWRLSSVKHLSEPPCRLVVRVRTSAYAKRNGLVHTKSVTVMRRMSRGHDFLDEDASMVGADLVMARITNLHEVDDGLYQVVTVNEGRDWETGYLEEWDYKLVPIE